MDVARAALDGDVAALDEVVARFYGGDSGEVRRRERRARARVDARGTPSARSERGGRREASMEGDGRRTRRRRRARGVDSMR